MYIRYKKEGIEHVEFLKTLTTVDINVINEESHKIFMENLLKNNKENRSLLKIDVIHVIQINGHQVMYDTEEDRDSDYNFIVEKLDAGKEMFTVLGDIDHIHIHGEKEE